MKRVFGLAYQLRPTVVLVASHLVEPVSVTAAAAAVVVTEQPPTGLSSLLAVSMRAVSSQAPDSPSGLTLPNTPSAGLYGLCSPVSSKATCTYMASTVWSLAAPWPSLLDTHSLCTKNGPNTAAASMPRVVAASLPAVEPMFSVGPRRPA